MTDYTYQTLNTWNRWKWFTWNRCKWFIGQ